MDTHELYDTIARNGLADPSAAERAARATLGAFAERLTVDETHALAGALPGDLGALVDATPYDGDFDAAELYERVRRREKTDAGTAREHAQIVLAAVAEHLPEDVLVRLRRHVGDLGALLGGGREPAIDPEDVHGYHAGHGRTLASGRPGSRHPVAESAPHTAQSQSVAANDDPHAETKLSSARGLTQERFGETLASGTGVHTRPIAETDDEPS